MTMYLLNSLTLYESECRENLFKMFDFYLFLVKTNEYAFNWNKKLLTTFTTDELSYVKQRRLEKIIWK